jgi:hypothetical protein
MITAFFRALMLLALACNPIGWVVLFFFSKKKDKGGRRDR